MSSHDPKVARAGESALTDVGMDTTRDAFLGCKVEIVQPASGFRAGIDAVLLAAAVPHTVDDTATLLDCGAGVGTVGLCAAARCAALNVVLIEREAHFAKLARHNIAINGLHDRVRLVMADVTAPGNNLAAAGISDNAFSFVAANPPFFVKGSGTSSPDALKAAGHEMEAADLDHWLRFMTRMARADGQLLMIQQSAALPAILSALEGRFGSIIVLPIHPRVGAAANRVLVGARKGSRGPLKILPGFVLHGPDNSYTEQAEAVFRHGAALEFFEFWHT